MPYSPYLWKRSAEIPLRVSLRNRLDVIGYPVYAGSAPTDANVDYPLIVLDNVTEDEFVTKTSEGSELVVKIDVYTHEEGYDQILPIKDAVIQAFNEPLQIPGWRVTYHALDAPGSITFKQDTFIAHSVIYLRFKLTYTG